jgi:alpha-D-xyloside xylohydrolase
LRTRDERNGYFYTPAPALVPASPRTVEALGEVQFARQLEGGLLLEGETLAGTPVQVALRICGSPPALRCTLSSPLLGTAPGADRASVGRRRLARPLPACEVTISASGGRAEISSGALVASAELSPFKLVVRAGDLVLAQDRSTDDPNGRLVVLPLGLTRLRGGPSDAAFHETFFAEPDEHFWGFGEKFTSMDKRGQLISCWNHDALGCTDERSYKNVPFFISSRGYAAFVDTTGLVEFDMCHFANGSWSVVVADSVLDYYLLFGGPEQCLTQYQQLVGGPEVPPAWSFGTWLSTGFSTDSEERTRRRLAEVERHQFPCDVLHLDTYWQRFGQWSDLAWDDEAFPDPVRLLADIHAAGLHASLWINPYIGVESPAFGLGEAKGYFLRGPDGSAWTGELWGDYHPAVAIVDMTNPEAVSWWAGMLEKRLAEGADAFKTDFGEAIPADTTAHDGTRGAMLHNAYPLLYNDVVMAVMRSKGLQRPVVWARSTWAGGQRHPVQWSGDSNSTWQDLAATLRAGLSMAMSGHHFWSHDIGGFHGEPSVELFVRWAQFGLLSPFSRFHGVTARMPWDFGPEALAAIRHVADVRARLFPYIYALAWCSAISGTPIMRPMVLDHPRSADAQAADMQYLLGTDLLVAPCYRPGGQRPVWFPPGRWVHYASGEAVDGPRWEDVSVPLGQAPLWVRAGALLPTLRPRLHIGERPPACEELVVVLASGTVALQLGGSTAGAASSTFAATTSGVGQAPRTSGDGACAGLGANEPRPSTPAGLALCAPLVAHDGPAGAEILSQARIEMKSGTLHLSGPAELAGVPVVVVGAGELQVTASFEGRPLPLRKARTLAGAWEP